VKPVTDWWNKLPRFTTLATLEAGDVRCILKGERAVEAGMVECAVRLSGPLRVRDGLPQVPVDFFTAVMHAYVTDEGDQITIERSGHIVRVCHGGPNGYVPACEVLEQMDVDFGWDAGQGLLRMAVETRCAGHRELTPAELALPYAKYYTSYWDTPFHLRADVRAWSEKAGKYQLSAMAEPSDLLHIREVRRLLEPAFRREGWHEGWTLFPDGTGVVCVKTYFPETTSEMFQWWFAWHALEDIRYMLWYPPAHYGIAPTLEYRRKLADPTKTLFEKTHGGDAVHMVYESTQIDALSYVAAKAVPWHSIPFQDPQVRGFAEEDLAHFKQKGYAAICGGQRMLHFFAEREDGTGGDLYTHFWFGIHPDGRGSWQGRKNAPDSQLIPPILNIAQHAVKEFAQLAQILPQIYREEGGKPICAPGA